MNPAMMTKGRMMADEDQSTQMMKGRMILMRSTVTMMRRGTVTGPSKVPTMMKGRRSNITMMRRSTVTMMRGRWSTVTGPSVVMNGTVVGGSLSTNLPHTTFDPVTSMKMQKYVTSEIRQAEIQKSNCTNTDTSFAASDASLVPFRRICKKYLKLSTAANSHRGLTNI